MENGSLKSVYEEVYLKNPNYNFHFPPKDLLVDIYANEISGRILDAGCGQGIHFKRMLENKIDAFGIELSTVCCDKYLVGLPHENIDICKFSQKKQQKFDGIVCFDVLEHIPENKLDETIESLSSMSSSVFLGLANHSDIQYGKELHLIQESIEWWQKKLSKSFKVNLPIISYFDGAFFCIEVSNREGVADLSYRWKERYRNAIQIAAEYDLLWKQNHEAQSEFSQLQVTAGRDRSELENIHSQNQLLSTENKVQKKNLLTLENEHLLLKEKLQTTEEEYAKLSSTKVVRFSKMIELMKSKIIKK